MTQSKFDDTATTTSSTGHALSEASWLDTHFEVARAEYETMLRDVGIQPGWHVLDAGCGGGSFLPLMSELVGPTGKITALDLAPENVALVEQQVAAHQFACPVEVHQGSTTQLPFGDNSFDAVWCANVVQYLTKAEFHQAATEFYRVLRPDGILALKEADLTALTFGPFEPTLIWHKLADRYQNDPCIGTLCTTYYRQWLRNAGFSVHSHKTYLGEDQHPLSEQQVQLLRGALGYWASLVEKAPDIPEEEKAIWRRKIADVNNPEHIIHDPDFYLRRPYALILASVSA